MRKVAIEYTSLVTRIAAGCAALIALSLFLYGIFLLEAVAHTASRAETRQEMKTVMKRLSSLEMQYLEKTRSMTPERASELGFVAPQRITTVFAAASILTLSDTSASN